MQQFYKYLALALTAAAAVTLIAFEIKPAGWLVLATAITALAACDIKFAKHLILVHGSLAILAFTPVATDISTIPALTMAAFLAAALLFPYLITKYVYKEQLISFPFKGDKPWTKQQYGYIALTAVLSYLILPYYLTSTGAYLNWPAVHSNEDIFKLFIGTNALGIWDELFFICTVLALLKNHMKFWLANLAQAILFTSFLHELGFTSWAFVPIFIFALLQGYIFNKTHALGYIIAIHLTLDFVLFLALVNAHNPSWAPIFIT